MTHPGHMVASLECRLYYKAICVESVELNGLSVCTTTSVHKPSLCTWFRFKIIYSNFI